MLEGFYYYTPRVDYFFVTNQQKRTKNLCEKVKAKLEADGNLYTGTFGTFSIHDMLDHGTIEREVSEKWGVSYNIRGDGYRWSAGSFEKDKHTEIVYL